MAKFLKKYTPEPEYEFRFTRSEALLIADVFCELEADTGILLYEQNTGAEFRPIDADAVEGIVQAVDAANVYTVNDDWSDRWERADREG